MKINKQFKRTIKVKTASKKFHEIMARGLITEQEIIQMRGCLGGMKGKLTGSEAEALAYELGANGGPDVELDLESIK